MTQKSDTHVFIGLQQDISISKLSPEHLIDAHNIRITAKQGETLFSLTNEKGPLLLNMVDTTGNTFSLDSTDTIIGFATLNEYLVLFVKGTLDLILRVDMEQTSPMVLVLFKGDLGFNVDYPIEAIVDYENLDIQKVYWTDGLNLPRVINIMKSDYTWEGSFDFNPELQLEEDIIITKESNTSGLFAPGVIQYAFTYYNKYAQETSVFYTSPLKYISYYDRGANPEDTVTNAFKIVVTNLDTNFEYLRIYSIHRTSLNGTPVCKRVLDLKITGANISFIDTGNEGDTVDSTSLLYKNSEELIAKTICSKDGTMFLGNLQLSRKSIRSIEGIKQLSQSLTPSTKKTMVQGEAVSSDVAYPYTCCLNTNAAGFKNREYYRLGYQAQYKDGTWSDPIWIKDFQVKNDAFGKIDTSRYSYGLVDKLIINVPFSLEIQQMLLANGYKKVRPLVVFPELQDRTVLCQGIGNPTISSNSNIIAGLNALSSWFWRPLMSGVNNVVQYRSSEYYTTSVCAPFSSPVSGSNLPYQGGGTLNSPAHIRGVEIQGCFDMEKKFYINWSLMTMHSPEFEFSDLFKNFDFTGTKIRIVGNANFNNTYSTIDITTSTPTISELGSGFLKKTFNTKLTKGIIGGLFWDDYLVDDADETTFTPYDYLNSACKYQVYPWQALGSLNNDCNRPTTSGQRTAALSKKVISNLRNSLTLFLNNSDIKDVSCTTSTHKPQIFDSDEVTALKIKNLVYEGNIDAMLTPDDYDGTYFCFDSNKIEESSTETPFTSTMWWKTFAIKKSDGAFEAYGTYKWGGTEWSHSSSAIGDTSRTLVIKKEPIRMKYKTTPHLVFYNKDTLFTAASTSNPTLPILEVYRDYDSNTMFGGQTEDAFKANTWIPAGDPVVISENYTATLEFIYGDTWFSKYDHLKTYPYTKDDLNQIVEIGSFELETRLNIDGRYDRNRNQLNNINITPENFNKFNSVYSQKDNYFTYKILDEDYYNIDKYPTEITWSLLKSAGAEIDPWTSITLSSTFDLDGTYGELLAIVNWLNNLYCFQDTNISNLLFNSRVQIPTSEGAPIEITNNYKVDGKRDIVNNVGCINKYSICKTPLALYFIDSVSNHLMTISTKGFNDLTLSLNMHTWYSKLSNEAWLPNSYSEKVFYDAKAKDLYTVTSDTALGYNEVFNLYTSFYSYGETDFMFNIVDDFYCVKGNNIYKMFEGEYNKFFGNFEPYDITFVSNGKGSLLDLSSLDKTYSTMSFLGDVFDGETLTDEFPFSNARLWDEYQDTGIFSLTYTLDYVSSLKKKFRTWHLTIPRDISNGRDRIRNTWCKIMLQHVKEDNYAMVLHNTEVQYFV